MLQIRCLVALWVKGWSLAQIAILDITSSGWSLMYSTKSVRMRSGTLRRSSLYWMLSKTTQSCLLLRKKVKEGQIPDTKFHKIWNLYQLACHTLSKALAIPSATAQAALYLLKAFTRRSAVDEKSCSWLGWHETVIGIRKEATFLKMINKPIIYNFFKYFTNHKYKTTRAAVFSGKLLPKILDHTWNLPAIWKARFLQAHIEEFSRYVESMKVQDHTSLITRITTGIQSEPDAFGKSRLVMTFAINLVIAEILCIFRSVLEGLDLLKQVKRYKSNQDLRL